MDIEKAFEEFVEKEWHDGHEPQGIDDQYVEEVLDGEDVELDEKLVPKIKFKHKSQYLKPKKKDKKSASKTTDEPFAFGISRKGGFGVGGGYGKRGGAPITMGDDKTYIKGKAATGYDLYHKDFSSAMQHAYKHAKKKGFTVDPKEIDDKVATGPKKPSSGKTNRYALKAGKRQFIFKSQT